MTDDGLNQDIKKISLSVSTDELEKFCNKLLKRSRDIAKTHDSLSTLEAFFTMFGKEWHGSNEYNAVLAVLEGFCEKTRQQLLDEKTGQLLKALKILNIDLITGIHLPLSRSGFYQILEIAIASLTSEELDRLVVWSSEWVNEAKHRAEQASGYPDALDFKKAGINIKEYQTMVDVNHYLQNTI